MIPEQRFVFVTGKGGTGKTTVATLICSWHKERSSRATLVEFEGSGRAGRLARLAGIDQVQVGYAEAVLELVATVTGSRRLAQLVLRQRAVARLVQALPAVRELASLESLRALSEQRPGVRLVVDLPATGQGIDWLRVVPAARRFLSNGPLARVCDRVIEQVLAPARSAVVVVSSLEPMVASETCELCERLRLELGRTPALVVANRVPYRPDGEAVAELERMVPTGSHWGLLRQLVLADLERARLGAEVLEMLGRRVPCPLVTIPELGIDPTPAQLLSHLGAASWPVA